MHRKPGEEVGTLGMEGELREEGVERRDSNIKFFILRNMQLQREHNKMILHTCDQEIYRYATLDYGQWWLVLNPFPDNKHQVIKFHTLHNYM